MPSNPHNSLDYLKQKSCSSCIIHLMAPLCIHNTSLILHSHAFIRPQLRENLSKCSFTALELQLWLFVCLLNTIIQLMSRFCIQGVPGIFNIILVFECGESPREKISHVSRSYIALVNGCPEHQSVLFNKSFQSSSYSVWLLAFNFP